MSCARHSGLTIQENCSPFRPKPIRTISGRFWNFLADSNSIFVIAIFLFERFELLVCSMFNHMQRDCTCACAVACLHPHNSISNVVVSLTIHNNIHLYLSEMQQKNMKPSWKVKGFLQLNIMESVWKGRV